MNIGSFFHSHIDSLSQGGESATKVWYKQTGSLALPNQEFGTAELGERVTFLERCFLKSQLSRT